MPCRRFVCSHLLSPVDFSLLLLRTIRRLLSMGSRLGRPMRWMASRLGGLVGWFPRLLAMLGVPVGLCLLRRLFRRRTPRLGGLLRSLLLDGSFFFAFGVYYR